MQLRSPGRRLRLVAAIAIAAVCTALGSSVTALAASADDLPFTTVGSITVLDIDTDTVGAQAGDLALADSQGWSPTPVSATYQWYFNDVLVDGGTDGEYQVPVDDFGGVLHVDMTVMTPGYATTTVSSPDVAVLGQLTHSTATFAGTLEAGQTITVANDNWTPSDGTTLSYLWYGTGVAPGDTTDSYTLTDGNLAGVSVRITATHDGYGASIERISTGHIVPDVLIPLAAAYQRWQHRVGHSTADPQGSRWNPQPTSFSYRWLRGGKAIANATKPNYVLGNSDLGHTVSVRVTGHLDGYTDVSTTSESTATVKAAHTHLPRPTVTGTAEIGRSLTAHMANINTTHSTVSYWEWYVDGVLDPDQTGPTYYPDSKGDVGKTITAAKRVWVGNGAAQDSEPSKATEPVKDGVLHHGTATIDGEVNEASSPFYLGPIPTYPDELTFRWYRDGVQVSTSSEYLATSADWHHTLRVAVSAVIEGLGSVTTWSNTAVVETGFADGAPVLEGTAQVGKTITANISKTTPTTAHMSVRWYEGTDLWGNHTRIGSGATFTPSSKYAGKRIFAAVVVTGGHVESDRLPSKSVVVVAGTFAAPPTPTIVGTPTVGSKLAAQHGVWSPSSSVTYTYQWYEQATATSARTKIAHATSSTLKLGASLEGELITVRVGAHHTGYTSASALSAPTDAVAG